MSEQEEPKVTSPDEGQSRSTVGLGTGPERNGMKIAYLNWSLHVECRACGETTDLSDDDSDGIIASAIFNNNWGALQGYEAACSHCGHEFKVDYVEY